MAKKPRSKAKAKKPAAASSRRLKQIEAALANLDDRVARLEQHTELALDNAPVGPQPTQGTA